MKLKHFRIQNYRSIVDSGVVDVADITVLIGANESGKSSILQGLASISMDSAYQYFDLTQLDRILKRYNDLELKAEDIEIVWGTFELSEDDENELKSILRMDERVTTLEVTKCFDESYEILIGENIFRIPSRYLFKSTQEKIAKELDSLQEQAQSHLQRAPNNQLTQQFKQATKEANGLS